MDKKIITYNVPDFDRATDDIEKKIMRHKERAKNQLFTLLNESNFKILSGFIEEGWKTDTDGNDYLMFDFKLPSGHIEFTVEVTGWGGDPNAIDGEA